MHQTFTQSARVLVEFESRAGARIADVAREVAERLRTGGRLLAFGNGGSAAEAQHLACELVGRFRRERRSLAALSLTADASTVTALANDFGFEAVFERQVVAHARRGDVAVAFSTSGRSENVLRGLRAAKAAGCFCLGLTGGAPTAMDDVCDVLFQVPSRDTARIQECHQVWVHALCDLVEMGLAGEAR